MNTTKATEYGSYFQIYNRGINYLFHVVNTDLTGVCSM